MLGLKLSSLKGRFLALVALLLVTLSVTMTTLAADREAQALFGEVQRTARTTGKLLEPSAINWVLRGDVSDLDQALRAVRRQDGVIDAYVLDPRGRVLAAGTGKGPGDETLAGIRRRDALAARAAGVVRHGRLLDAVNPLETSGERLGALVVGYDLTAAERTLEASRYRGLMTGLGFAALGLVVTWLLVSGVTRRLLLLTEAAQLAAREQLPRLVRGLHAGDDPSSLAPPPLDVRSFDEVNRLAGAFNAYRSVVVDMATDLTALAKSSDARLRRAFDSSPIGMALATATGELLEVNGALCAMLGRSRAELLGTTFDRLAHPDDRGPLTEVDVHGSRRSGQTDRRYLRPDGSIVWTLHTATVERGSDGILGHVFSQVVDTTEQKRAEADMAHLAFHDALTGLPNRALLADRSRLALARSGRHEKHVALLLIDLDGFKAVNDSLGHGAGDHVLCAAADRLRRCLRDEDTAARLGGDEFALLLEVDTRAEALEVGERIRRSMRAAFTHAGRELFLTASVGVAFATAHALAGEDLLRDADLAMYQAKRNGKDEVCVYDPLMHDAAADRLRLDGELRGALDRGELLLHYQPIYGIDGHPMVAVEALMRWNHPTRGFIPPHEFIPVAENSGLIVALGSWALDEACRQLRQWQDAAEDDAVDDLQLSVNLSARQLTDAHLPDIVAEALDRHGVAPHRLTLEITESMMVDDVPGTIRRLGELKALGLQLAVDDFGTGYSSLQYLQQFPIDRIKLDKSFVDELVTAEGRALAEGIINLARSLTLVAIAEGVENEFQRTVLDELGCPLGQGYHFARPEAPGDIAGRLAAARRVTEAASPA